MKDKELKQNPPLVWDNTLHEMALTCPRKLYWFLRGFRSSVQSNPFVWGSTFHKMLAVWHNEYSLDEAKRAGIDLWNSNPPDESSSNDNIIKAIGKLERYAIHYGREDWKVLKVEHSWKHKLCSIKGTDIYLGGRQDALIEDPVYGIHTREDKTTQYITDNFVDGFAVSQQVTGYCWANKKEGRTPICTMNLIAKPIPGPRAKWTTPEFLRVPITKNSVQLLQFEHAFEYDIRVFFETIWDRWTWPMSGTIVSRNCVGGLEFSRCTYHSLCKIVYKNYKEIDPLWETNSLQLTDKLWEPWNETRED